MKNPLRTHEPLLSDISYAQALQSDEDDDEDWDEIGEILDSKCVFEHFKVHQKVEAWYEGEWYPGTVMRLSPTTRTLSIYWTAENFTTSGYRPHHVRPAQLQDV